MFPFSYTPDSDIDEAIISKEARLNNRVGKKNPPCFSIINKIITAVSIYYGHDYDTLRGASRRSDIVLARHLMHYLLFEFGMTYAAIGKLTNRDHSTIIHSVIVAKDMIYLEPNFKHDYIYLSSILKKKRGELL